MMTAFPDRRITIELDGQWDVGESLDASSVPSVFPAKGPVPGLVNLAEPRFSQVDEFDGYELFAARVQQKKLPESERIPAPGRSRQPRNYFWYRRSFTAPARKSDARLRIAKAQFGTAVWLNGRFVGEDVACFSAIEMDLSRTIRWGEANELIVRIGAHPGVLPPDFPTGADFEKIRWTPGIYDTVSVRFSDAPVILSVQIASRISPPAITIATVVSNPESQPCEGTLVHTVSEWRKPKKIAASRPLDFQLAPGETRTFADSIELPGAKLWSTDHPWLYQLATDTGGDCAITRFGVREFRSDSSTGRFYLNGDPCYLRGSNVSLHRFFEDPLCGRLPWTESWVRKLLGEIPRQMGWNSFRFTIGPVPDRWLEIADEHGLLIQNEFFVWTSHPRWYPGYERKWNRHEMTRQFKHWMQDNWNHPSLVVWDACNETWDSTFDAIIREVRNLDLSGRPWDNGYNAPVGEDDPAEIHTYFYASSFWENKLQFHLDELETKTVEQVIELGTAVNNRAGHPLVINEYGWLWLHRGGTPTAFTARIYEFLLGPEASPDARLALLAYILAAETEFYRALRAFAGVQHFTYLTCTHPEAVTADNFRDVESLKLDPYFAEWVGESFQPLGICLWFFADTLLNGSEKIFKTVVINDTRLPASGTIVLVLGPDGGAPSASATASFSVAGFEKEEIGIPLKLPHGTGRMLLSAEIQPFEKGRRHTRSRRWVTLV